MPELPEVETIRRDLEKFIINKKIVDLEIRLPRLIKSEPKSFVSILENNSFTKIKRTGKLLQFELKKNPELHLLIHLRMTGQLVYCQNKKSVAGGHSLPEIKDCEPNKYTYVIFSFSDKSKLFFSDMRTFGALKIVNSAELIEILERFGIEPLQKNFKFNKLKTILNNRNSNIKTVLLNQQLISGIGNIYADEILFRAGIMPLRIASTLDDNEVRKIFNASNYIIKQAIDARGTTFNNYVDGRGNKGSFVKLLKVYGRGGKPCKKCGNPLVKIKLNGRGTVYCEKCQR